MDDSFERACQFPTTLLVPGLPTGCPLLSRWSGVQRLAVYPHPAEGAGQWVGLSQVSWDAALWNSITRRLANQSHSYFMSLHELSSGGKGLQGSEVLLYSRYYRSALHECVLGLRAEARKRMAERELPGPSQYEQQAELFATMGLVWHLIEILFIEVLPAGCLVQQLVEWVCWAGREGERERLQDILDHTPPESNGDYWTMVYRLVLTGRLSEARNLLAQHSATGSMERLFSSMDELLRKAPMVRPSSSLTRAELQHNWQQWRRECGSRREAGDFLAVPPMQLLARVLCGDEEVFKHEDVVGSCQSWYELMVGRLLFTSPLVISTDYDLVYAAETSVQTFGPGPAPLNALLMAALRQNALEVVSLASSELSNWWLAAHLADLLQQRDILHSQPEYGSKLTEFLVLEYASSLLTHQSLWQVAMDYFSECPTQGRHHMALHVERVPLTSARKATKVLQLCQRFQLREQAQSVCRVLAMREFRSGRLGAAMSWCLQAKDSIFAAFLAEKYFASYQSLGEFMDLDLLDHLGSAMLLSEKLTFLGKYREFHQLYVEEQFSEAGQLLVSLLQSGIVPKRFWLTLLTDALPLLDLSEQIVFSAEDTATLAHCLQQLTSQPKPNQSRHCTKSRDSGKESHDSLAAHSSKISLLRVALCRNMARASLEDIEQSV